MPKKITLQCDELNQLKTDYSSGQTLRQLELKYPYGRKILSRLLKEAGVDIRDNTENSRRYSHDENYFAVIDTPGKAYWLGFIYADGFIESKRAMGNQKLGITIAECDADHLDKFKQCIKSTNPIKVYTGSGYSAEGRFAKILLTSQKMVDDLKHKGVHENKTYELTFPSTNIVPKRLQQHFVRGYFDGDGSLSYWTRHGVTKESKNYLLGFTGTYSMLSGINEFFNKDLVIKVHHEAYEINFGGNQQLKDFLNFIYEDATVYLDRKYEIYLDYLKYVERQG